MYIKSAEIESVDGKNYLRLFVDKKYPYTVKVNDEEVSILELFLEEPTFSDIGELKKLGISIEKLASYDSIKSIRIANTFSKESIKLLRDQQEEEIQEIKQEESQKEEPTEEEDRAMSRYFISDLFARSTDFENDETDYFKELNKFIKFIDSKSNRNINNILMNNPLSVFDQYNATSLFIKEAIVIEYVSFFFAHFPSRSLHLSLI